jgi:hypothetical protein
MFSGEWLWSYLLPLENDSDLIYYLWRMTLILSITSGEWLWSDLLPLENDSDLIYYLWRMTLILSITSGEWLWFYLLPLENDWSYLLPLENDSDLIYYLWRMTLILSITSRLRGRCGRNRMVVGFTTTCPISTNVVSSNPAQGKVYSIQHYMIQLPSDLRQVSGFLQVFRFTQPIQLTATI